jgi:uncharacterized membrane protein YqjE
MPYTAMRYTGFGLIGFAFLAFVCWLIHEIFRILDAALTITVLIVVVIILFQKVVRKTDLT